MTAAALGFRDEPPRLPELVGDEPKFTFAAPLLFFRTMFSPCDCVRTILLLAEAACAVMPVVAVCELIASTMAFLVVPVTVIEFFILPVEPFPREKLKAVPDVPTLVSFRSV